MPSYTDLGIPPSEATVEVRALDLTPPNTRGPAASVMMPVVPGNEIFVFSIYSFLIENPKSKKRVMFDLGPRKDLENCAPVISIPAKNKVFEMNLEKDVTELLVEGGIALGSVDSVIWSHSHFDHIGDMSKFPSTTELVIGQGTVRNIYPANPEGTLLESDFHDRKVTELNFDNSNLTIGGFRAFDYFEDGSIYLLDVPGHMSGHISALARVTPTSFLFLGGDICHHVGQIRPTEQLHRHFPCPGQLVAATRRTVSAEYFSPTHMDGGFDLLNRTEPLLDIPEKSVHEDTTIARVSIRKLRDFDANEDVFVLIAHDASMMSIVETFPATLNKWKEKGWKEKAVWGFMNESNLAFRFGIK